MVQDKDGWELAGMLRKFCKSLLGADCDHIECLKFHTRFNQIVDNRIMVYIPEELFQQFIKFIETVFFYVKGVVHVFSHSGVWRRNEQLSAFF